MWELLACSKQTNTMIQLISCWKQKISKLRFTAISIAQYWSILHNRFFFIGCLWSSFFQQLCQASLSTNFAWFSIWNNNNQRIEDSFGWLTSLNLTEVLEGKWRYTQGFQGTAKLLQTAMKLPCIITSTKNPLTLQGQNCPGIVRLL